MPAPLLEYETPVPPPRLSNWQAFQRVALIATAVYLFIVAFLTVAKLSFPIIPTPWPEVFYGPAITVVGCVAIYALVWFACSAVRWFWSAMRTEE